MTDPFAERLRVLIGQRCDYDGRPCQVVEVLSGQGLLVLQARDQLPPVQFNQYGQAGRRIHEIIEVPLYGPDQAPSVELMQVLEGLAAEG